MVQSQHSISNLFPASYSAYLSSKHLFQARVLLLFFGLDARCPIFRLKPASNLPHSAKIKKANE
jgi:hypothetical protein